jgi:hypothetical protein
MFCPQYWMTKCKSPVTMHGIWHRAKPLRPDLSIFIHRGWRVFVKRLLAAESYEHGVLKGIWYYGGYWLVSVMSRTLMSLLSTLRSRTLPLSSPLNTGVACYSKNFIQVYHFSWRHIPCDRTKSHTGAVGNSHSKFQSPFNFVTWQQRALVTASDRQTLLAFTQNLTL